MSPFISLFQSFNIELISIATLIVLFFIDIFSKKERIGTWSIVFTFILFLFHIFNWGKGTTLYPELYVNDALAYFFKAFFILTSLFVLIMSRDYAHNLERGQGEFFLLILMATLGMIFLSSSVDFLVLFVSLELVTISFFIMSTYLRTDAKSIEAGLKYLILAALSSGFLLYGISFIYGVTGSTHFSEIVQYVAQHPMNEKILLLGFLMILAGIGFKIAAVPFQLWVPDVYEGSPTPVSAFLSVGSKAAGFVVLVRLLFSAFPQLRAPWILVLSLFSAMTLLYGNLGAIPQKNIKRFLGYSSIGHAGYLLMGLAAGSSLGLSGVLYYLLSYLFTNLGIFLIIVTFSNVHPNDEISDYTGLSKRSPFLAAAMLIALMSLAGVPPLSGFFGKFLLISSAVKGGLTWLAFLGAANVVISLYYYLMIVKKMYMDEPQSTTPITISLPARIAILISMVGILFLGVFQEPALQIIDFSIKGLLTSF
ncbi:MAG: NADH-quinone oxidoreductase subunit N [Chlamydiae bacterium]|nr:NADH-quinone oxidoreductase subunit N [Chlamydiota bacterium]MBI3277768.1 NADH-quinone oxidoreductase subunit N [Chlamydiota bacterium]